MTKLDRIRRRTDNYHRISAEESHWLVASVDALAKAAKPLADAADAITGLDSCDPEHVFLWARTSNVGPSASISLADAQVARAALARLDKPYNP